MKAAHHGSRNSSSEIFLQKVRPKYTIISAGIENSYGHPHRETIERLEKSRQPDLSYGKIVEELKSRLNSVGKFSILLRKGAKRQLMKNLNEDLKTGNIKQAYLLYGEEAYLKKAVP